MHTAVKLQVVSNTGLLSAASAQQIHSKFHWVSMKHTSIKHMSSRLCHLRVLQLHAVLLLIIPCLQRYNLLVGLLNCISLLLQPDAQQTFLLLPLQPGTLLFRLAAAQCVLHHTRSITT